MKNTHSKSNRERFLLHLFPAALVLFAYSFLIALPIQRELTEQMNELHVVKQTAVSELQAEQSRQALQAAEQRLQREQERLEEDRLKIKTLSQNWRHPESRLETVQEITQMMGEFNLSIISQDYQTEPTIPNYFKDLTARINQLSPGAPPIQFWKVELEGAYLNVQRFLRAIDIDRMHTFPLTLNMDAEQSNNGQQQWTIVFVV